MLSWHEEARSAQQAKSDKRKTSSGEVCGSKDNWRVDGWKVRETNRRLLCGSWKMCLGKLFLLLVNKWLYFRCWFVGFGKINTQSVAWKWLSATTRPPLSFSCSKLLQREVFMRFVPVYCLIVCVPPSISLQKIFLSNFDCVQLTEVPSATLVLLCHCSIESFEIFSFYFSLFIDHTKLF